MASVSPRGAPAPADPRPRVARSARPGAIPPIRARPQVLAAMLVVALVSALGVAVAGHSAQRGAPPLSGPGSPTPPQAAIPAPQYRIVGCRSHGGPFRHGPSAREVAFGFDDGPAPDTSSFVSMLERARARATFFMIGEQVNSGYRSVLLRELRDGDVLGDHTFTHPDLTRTSNVRGQLQSTISAIRAVSGYAPCVFRPPYGAYNGSVVSTAHALGLATVLWNVDPRDWALPGTGAIVRTILAEVQPGSIIISHDGGGTRGQTLAAYPAVIAALRARRYRIVTIPELLGFRPVYRPCIKLCAGIGQPRGALPRNAIIERAP